MDACVLMALIHRFLDEFEYDDALLLAERLYALDTRCEEYQVLYAKCLYLLRDFNGAYCVLKEAKTIPGLHLFARSCLDLGLQQNPLDNKEDAEKTDRRVWSEGARALQLAIQLHKQNETETQWSQGEWNETRFRTSDLNAGV